MLYLTVQMLALLLVALLIGAGIGWLLRGARDAATQEAQANADAARIVDLRRDRDAAEAALATATAAPLPAVGSQTLEVQSALEACQAKVKDLEANAGKLADLQAALDECRAASNTLKTERDAAQAMLTVAGNKPEADASIADQQPSALMGSAADAQNTQKADAATTAEATAPDDLKLISGVGPKLEGVLHEAGITRFDQIATLTQVQIEDLNDILNFKGRIERDDWVGQAKRLAAGEKP